MFLVAVIVLGALAVPLSGGRLGALADLHLRRLWAIYAALGLAILGVNLPGLPDGVRSLLLVAAYPVGAVFLAANWRVPGVPLVALGAGLNLLAIAANGGVMPASPDALATAGLPAGGPGFQNSGAVADPRLAFLGDIFAIPASWPLSNVFSVGDVLIGAGLVWGLHRVCGSRLVPRWTGNPAAPPPGPPYGPGMRDDGWRARIRWVVVHPELPEVLLARRDGDLVLPEAERPGQVFIGDPGELLPPLREQLGGDAVLLRCLEEVQDPSARVQRVTMLAAARAPATPPEGTAWLGRADLRAAAERPGTGPADPGLGLAARVVADLEDGRPPAGLQPWAARGWYAQVEDWLAAEMEHLGRPLTGPVEQIRVWELSCILRAPTTAGDVWFKTSIAAPLFVNEGVVTRALAGLFPDHVPAPLAVDPERGWMVLAGFGTELGWDAPLEAVGKVARSFAGMQVEAAGHVDRLLAAGCHDRRLDRLAAQAAAWLPEAGADGRLPAMDTATWLSEEEAAALAAAVPRIRACCEELAALAVPASLVHGDLHLANVAHGPRGPLIFDWTDACVAHPFLDLATIRRGTGEIDAAEEELRARVRAAYLPVWSSFESPERLARAWELALPLGALHQAISYRSLVASLQPPIDLHVAQSTAWWLRQVLADLP